MKKIEPVLGHLCPGLEKFLGAVTSQCVPTIDPDGEVSGCDDSNRVTLQFCPFCGAGFQCPDCDQPVRPHARRECCYGTRECQPHNNWCSK